MLMALDERVGELVVQDVTMAAVPAGGVAADLGHLETPAKVTSFAMDPAQPPVDQLGGVLAGCDLVLVPAGVPRKPGMTRDDLFNVNAGIAKGIVESAAKYCPNAVLGLIVNPVNSIVPAMAELYKKKGLDPLKCVGVTTLDTVRANKFVAQTAEQTAALDVRTQDGGTEVVDAKAGKGSATLSMAYAGARFGKAVLDGLDGKGTTECA